MSERRHEHPAAADSESLTRLVADVLGHDDSAREDAVEEFRSLFEPLVERIASRHLSALPGYTLHGLVDEALVFLITGLHQDEKGEPAVRKAPLQAWLEMQERREPDLPRLPRHIADCVSDYFRDLVRQVNSKSIAGLLGMDAPELKRLASTTTRRLEDVEEARYLLRESLSRLSPRDIFILKKAYVEELTHREIARLIGTSVPHVQVLLRRARARLARLLEGESPDDQAGPRRHKVTARERPERYRYEGGAGSRAGAGTNRAPAGEAEAARADRQAAGRDSQARGQDISHPPGSGVVPFASPVVSSQNISARLKIGGEVAQPPIDLDDVVYLDE